MIHYSISYKNPLSSWLDIKIQVKKTTPKTVFQIPAWRPGRYELQNYAGNIRNVLARDEHGNFLEVKKTERNRWEVASTYSEEINFTYQYYAHQMDAGGCWLDDEQLYLNFVASAMYLPDRMNEACEVTLELPEDFVLACGLPTKEKNVLSAKDYYQLADSPMIASASLTHVSFDCCGVKFYLWMQGDHSLDKEKLLHDFERYTLAQLQTMGDFPEKEYHYLFQFLHYPHYHGVEHRNSTVITLGPSEKLASEKYGDLLGISSHELFHAWNICKIRPVEMVPYDFSKENYFPTGFVAEGFTTYYGDLFLYRSGVISEKEYVEELNKQLKRHFENYGNGYLSLAESSIDLWVDGYRNTAPDRKVSIYVKGGLAAFILDAEIQNSTGRKKSLDDLMRVLWLNYGKESKGYSMEDIRLEITKFIGENATDDFLGECIFGKTDMKERLEKAVVFFWMEMEGKKFGSRMGKKIRTAFNGKRGEI